MRTTLNNVADVLNTLIREVGREGIISFEMIKEKVREVGMSPKDWMIVRNVMAYYMVKGFLTRTQNVHVEEYQVTDEEGLP